MKYIIPDVKKKTTFVFGLTLKDIAIASLGMLLVILILAANMAFGVKVILAILFLLFTVLAVLQIDVLRGYQFIFLLINYWTRRHKFISLDLTKELKMGITDVISVQGVHTAVIELNGIDFSVLSVYNQNSKIAEFMEILKEVKDGKMVKLEKPLEFEKHIQENEDYIADIIAEMAFLESKNKSQTEEYRVLSLKLEALTNQNDKMIYLEDVEQVVGSAFYLLVQDGNAVNLHDTVDYCMERLSAIGLCPNKIVDTEESKELSTFIQRFYNNNPKFEPQESVILPDVREKLTKINLGGKDYRVMCVHKYSPFVENAWAWKLLRIPDSKVVINFRAYAGKSVEKLFDRQMLEIKTALSDNKIKDTARNKLEGDYYILQNLINDVQFGKDKMLDMEFYIMYPDENHKKIMKEFRSAGLTMNDLYLQQYEGYLNMYPYLKMNTKKSPSIQVIPASSAAAMFPFVIKQLDDNDGHYLGGSGGLPVFFDLFNRSGYRTNSNIVVLGKPGGGKSFMMKKLLFNYAIRGKKILLLDPENEYRYLSDKLGGNYIDVSGARKGIINPLQVFPAFSEGEVFEKIAEVSQHLQFLEQFFKTIAPDLEAYALNVLLDLIKTLYRKFNITDDNDITVLPPTKFPTFDDLAVLLSQHLGDMEKRSTTEFEIKTIRTLQMTISKFTNSGIYSSLWNGHTTMDISNNFTVFNFQSLFANNNNTVANAQMLLVVKYLNQEVIKNREKGTNNVIIAIDEAHRYINAKFPVALDFMQQMAKQVRKYFGSLIVTTQNIDDFIGVSPEIKQKASGVINSCQYSFIFSLQADDLNKVKEMYSNYSGGLQEEEVEYVANGKKGDCLLIVDVNTRLPVHITPFENEVQYFEDINKKAS